MSHRSVVGLVFFAFSLQFGFTQAIPVIGVTDRSDNTDSVSFNVPAEPGYAYQVLLDGKPVPAGVTNRVTKVDYHEIFVVRSNATTHVVDNRLVRFVILSSNRGDPERGLIEWTPYPQIPSANAEVAGAALLLMAPSAYPAEMNIPVIARVENPSGHARRVNGSVTAAGQPSFRIIRGHGSGFLPAGAPGATIEYGAQVGPIGAYKEIQTDISTTWTTVPGTLSGNIVWPEDSRMQITGNVTLTSGSTLTIGAGTVVRLNPLVNIVNSGRTVINGTVDRPVVFTSTNTAVLPEVRTYAWGGFFIKTPGAELHANGCIFVGGGGNTGINFSPGSSHKSDQPVFLVHSNALLKLTNCAVINTAGQVGNGYESDVTYDHCLLQRAITAGEYVGGTIIVNESALIEFPADNDVVNATIADGDYDAIYFTTGTHLIYNSLLGFCKDDATDSGSGGGGTVLATNCWFESALHEANAWSNDSGVRNAQTYDSVLMNSGQGFECGWSGAQNSPLCYAGNILSIGNSIGVRFGDNYPSIATGLLGFERVTNSFVLYNYRDVWGMQWRSDSTGWYYRSNQMDIRDNFITQANPFHPTNTIWNGASDGWRLARFMTTPPDAPVGIGFATWTNTFPIARIFDGVPVRLSTFTTNAVQVDYVFQAGVRPPVSGTLTFSPGETVKRVFPYGFDVSTYSNPRVILVNPVGGELTGNTNVQFQGTAPSGFPNPLFGYKSQHDRARLAEGYPLGLSAPSGLPFTAGYEYRSAGGILSTGVITFPPGETLAWAQPPATGTDIVQFVLLFNLLPASVTAYYLPLPPPPSPLPPVTLIARGSTWKYPNVAGQLDTSWKTASFNDTAWLSGPTELGFGDGDEARAITKLGSQLTYYFRKVITVADPNAFGALSLWIRRDDGAVMHFNGTEVFRSSSMPPLPNVIGFSTVAVNQGDNAEESASLTRNGLIAGDNVVAVEIHQDDPGSSDISFNMELLGNPVVSPRVIILRYGNQLLVAWSDPLFVPEQADVVTGPWSPVNPNTSPVVIQINPSISQKFYRVKR